MSKKQKGTPSKKPKKPQRNAGGSATGGGMNFQGAVTAIAGVHVLAGSRLDWLEGIVDDTPAAVLAETGGSGDDIRLELSNGESVEVQAKKGLQTSEALWTSLIGMSAAVHRNEIGYGVLAAAPDSSRVITSGLSLDLKRLADGRTDGLSDLGSTFREKLEKAGLPLEVCKRIRITVLNAIPGNVASIGATKILLERLCGGSSEAAWNRIFRSASALIERRGRWTAIELARELMAEGIELIDHSSPSGIISAVSRWVADSNASFPLFGSKKMLPTDPAWIALRATPDAPPSDAHNIESALAEYHDGARRRSHNREAVQAEYTGRFYRHAVVVAGPGLGKSTLLTKMARLYAQDGYPVLKVALRAVAARMAAGHSFVDSLFQLGLDGSSVTVADAEKQGLTGWVVLCDGLDECAGQQTQVANAIRQLVIGHSNIRVVVTTRPVGYDSAHLADWRHYELLSPEEASGQVNLANLLEHVTQPKSQTHENASAIAGKALKESSAADVISRSPLLIGMAASLLASGGNLGATKSDLYQNLFKLIDDAPNPRLPTRSISRPILNRVVNILGWELLANPYSSAEFVATQIAKQLAPEIGTSVLAAEVLVTDSIEHWEHVGLIERVHFGHTAILTFIHKTFGEFAAARTLSGIEDPSRRMAEIDKRVDDSAWNEVFQFAAAMGLADEIVRSCIAPTRPASLKATRRAIELLPRLTKEALAESLDEVAALGLEVLDSGDRENSYAIGLALADATPLLTDSLVLKLSSQRSSTFPWAQLIAWTCIHESRPQVCTLTDAIEALRKLGVEDSYSRTTLLGGYGFFPQNTASDLLRRFALSIVHRIEREASHEEAVQFVESELLNSNFTTVAFQEELNRFVGARGLHRSLEMLKLLQPPKGYEEAFSKAEIALVRSAIPIGHTSKKSTSSMVQLGALYVLVGFRDTRAGDVWAWQRPYDGEMVREVITSLIKVSCLDATSLADEASEALRRIRADTSRRNWSISDLPHVDVPSPSWGRAPEVVSNTSKLEKALGHDSAWLVAVAANLLAQPGMLDEAKLRRLLNTTRGNGFQVATYLAATAGDKGCELLLTRLSGPRVSGLHYVYNALSECGCPWSESMAEAVGSGLLGISAQTAEQAARLALVHIEKGAAVPAPMLLKAFMHWLDKETPSPDSGVIPPSPRESLLKGLVRLDAASDEWLVELLSDNRRDVAAEAKLVLSQRMRSHSATRVYVVASALSHRIPPAHLAGMVRQDSEMPADQARNILALLEDSDPRYRMAALSALSNPRLPTRERKEHALKLANDSEYEIRKEASRLLSEVVH